MHSIAARLDLRDLVAVQGAAEIRAALVIAAAIIMMGLIVAAAILAAAGRL